MGPGDEFSDLEGAILSACAGCGEWPAGIASAVYAGVDHAIAHPQVVVQGLSELESESEQAARYDRQIRHLTELLQARAPLQNRLPGSTDEALVGGIVGLVGDHLRLGRVERLKELRPDLVLLVLLPYLGFAEAQRWANSFLIED